MNFGSTKSIKPTWYCSYCSKQNGTIDVQCKNTGCTVQKHCTRICAFIYKKKEHKSMIEKNK